MAVLCSQPTLDSVHGVLLVDAIVAQTRAQMAKEERSECRSHSSAG